MSVFWFSDEVAGHVFDDGHVLRPVSGRPVGFEGEQVAAAARCTMVSAILVCVGGQKTARKVDAVLAPQLDLDEILHAAGRRPFSRACGAGPSLSRLRRRAQSTTRRVSTSGYGTRHGWRGSFSAEK